MIHVFCVDWTCLVSRVGCCVASAAAPQQQVFLSFNDFEMTQRDVILDMAEYKPQGDSTDDDDDGSGDHRQADDPGRTYRPGWMLFDLLFVFFDVFSFFFDMCSFFFDISFLCFHI